MAEMMRLMSERAAQEPRGWVSAGFKAESNQGYDVYKNRTLDYGNIAYPTFLWTLAAISGTGEDSVANRLSTLAKTWPSLAVKHDHSNESLIKQGDVVELFFATFRGGFVFNEITALKDKDLPTCFNRLCEVMRCVHLLDARLRSGWLKYRGEPVAKWERFFDNTESLKDIWNEGSVYDRATVLVAFFRARSP